MERQEGYEADNDILLHPLNAKLLSDESMGEEQEQRERSKFAKEDKHLKVPVAVKSHVKWNSRAQIGYEKEFDSADYELELQAVKKAKEKHNMMTN